MRLPLDFVRILGLAGLLALFITSDGLAQDEVGRGALVRRTSASAPHAPVAERRVAARRAQLARLYAQLRPEHVSSLLQQHPIVVLPAGKGFQSLQKALDFAGRRGGGRGSQAAAVSVLLGPGTYTGNFVLPPGGVSLVGTAGRWATNLVGQTGVAQPTITFATSGGESLFAGISISGAQVAVVDYASSSSWADLLLVDCNIWTPAAIPGIRMSGGGSAPGREMLLELDHVDIGSGGDGIAASIDSYTEVFGAFTYIEAEGTGIDMQSSSAAGTELVLYTSAVEGSTGVVASNLEQLWSGMSYLEATGTVVDLSGIASAGIERGELHSESGDALRVSGTDLHVEYVKLNTSNPAAYGLRVLNSSSAQVAFCGFDTGTIVNAIEVDPTSTKATVHNHWRFSPLP